METPLYPDCTVDLTGGDGNAFAVIGRVSRSLRTYLRKTGTPASQITDEVARFQEEATSGDYGNLLDTCDRWVTVQ